MSLYFDEQEAVEKLRELGYRVIKVDFPGSASTIKDLLEYFYARRLYYNPDRPFPPSRNLVQDRNYLSGFVKKREQQGLSRKNAIREAAMLIEVLFRFEEHLKLRDPIMSPRVLEVGFIMERVCAIASDEIDEASEAETERYIGGINEVYNRKNAARDAELAAASRKRILERLNDERSRNSEGRTERD
jgi:hypothetical protein